MKKLMSFAMAVVLCLGMSTTVLAAPSPEINSPSVDNSGSNNSGSNNEGYVQYDPTAPVGSMNNPVTPDKKVGHSYNEAQNATLDQYDSTEDMFEEFFGISVGGFDENRVTELDLDAEIPEGADHVWVEIMKWSEIQFGEDDNTLEILHMTKNGKLESIQWNVIKKGEDLILVGKFTNFSPVWVAPLKTVTSGGWWYYDPEIDGPVNPSLGVSPKTADNSMTLYVMMLAAAACGTMVFKARKAK